MAKKNGKKAALELEEIEDISGENFFVKHNIKPIKIFAIFLAFLAVFTFSSLFGLAGFLGDKYFTFITDNLGVYAYLTPLGFLLFSYIILFHKSFIFKKINFWLFGILTINFFILLGFFKLVGHIGNGVTNKLVNSFGSIPTLFLLMVTTVLILFRVFETNILEIFKRRHPDPTHVHNMAEDMPIEEELNQGGNSEKIFSSLFSKLMFWKGGPEKRGMEVNHIEDLGGIQKEEEEYEYEEVPAEEEPEDQDVRTSMLKAAGMQMAEKVKAEPRLVRKPKPEAELVENKKDTEEKLRQLNEKYSHPPVSMYTSDTGKSSAGDNKENARIIKRTLNDFGISVEMDEVTVGPTVTRYALKPAQGVKIERIMNLANNIALELGVTSVSISRVQERALIGIEVPNKTKSTVGLSGLFGNKDFANGKRKLPVTFGKDIYGDPVFEDLADMPHLLVAGTTKSGKSVLLHSLINSLIFTQSPYDLKLILIDPKKVELKFYKNLPHLYTPIITEPKKAIQTLNWLVQEMDRRYTILDEAGKQNISAYHGYVNEKYRKAESGKTSAKLPEKMPYIVVIIDELADFMLKYPKEMESGIVKIAQMARAVGIHLILATQRPSTNVITGVIKGNIPSRVALRVASQIDSRVILDAGGAEKLLGYGDLLLMTLDNPDLRRVQSPFVSVDDISEVVAYLRNEYDEVVTEELKAKDGSVVSTQSISTGGISSANANTTDEEYNDMDDKYEEAKQVVLQTGKTSTSNLQVRLGTGYARSLKLINMLEQAGIINTITNNSGKKVKAVAGFGDGTAPNQQENPAEEDSEQLEDEADKLLSGKTSKAEADSFFRF